MDTLTSSPLRVHVLGGFELSGADGHDLTPPGRKLRALIAVLALAPAAGWSREQLTALLWGDRDEEQARGSLRQALAELRRIVGDSALLTDRETAAFDPAALRADAVEFARLAAAGEWEQAAALYRGELLDGVSLPDAGFADWLLVERTRLHDLAVGVLARFLHTQSGTAAIATAQRLLQLDPTREETHRALMRLYAAQGDRSQALRQYQICRDDLRRDLGVKPEPETERLCREIQSSTNGVAAAQARVPENGEAGGDMAADTAQHDHPPAGDKPASRASFTPKPLGASLAAAAVVVLALAGAGTWWLWPDAPSSAKPAIAVLPFDNVAGDEASRRLADGLTEDIITDLSRYREMDVIAHNSTKAYKDKSVDPRKIGEELNVRYVLEGSVQRDGDQIRITAQLIETRDGTHLWSDRWDRPAQDFFAVQIEIADQVGNRLGNTSGLVNKAEHQATRRSRPENLTAYELYLAGRHEGLRGTPESNKEANRLLQRAVEADPALARAWVELASVRQLSTSYGEDPAAAIPMALSAVRRAIEIDPGDALAHAVLGWILGMQGDFARSEGEFDTALRLNPGSTDILAL
ncbi:MAG: BTAD domain-containing putative transcriptional regulator, partial [Dongiaceae bacterium]